ncbi:WcaF family extracellular polysaccharide biosynthesis acetyltransferase [Paraflavisolibacter sp. H34]|uniref:WcaF family extracellular polysaccharide biosynthesis acetyltransferase n=1 Tax=Huijunlia imazamoxiresistens TaxID=3127457 RepID=UPI003015D781
MKTDLSLYNNSWYKPGSSLKIRLWMVASFLFFNHGLAVVNPLKIALLRLFGARVGRGVLIKPSVSIKYPWLLSIGDHCWIGERVWIDNLAEVRIGDHVCISQGAMLLAGNHNYSLKTFDLVVQPIVLEDGVWIGARSVVCPGVYCESHSVLAVQSVATKRMRAFAVYQGNPALPVKERVVG